MPTFLDLFVGERASDLDEKAQALLHEIDGVSALSILSRLHGHWEEVRNPSAFVASAVKAAKRMRGPGHSELERAVAQLKEDGILDDKSVDILQKSSLEAACSAIIGLLVQDESTVRSPSAYVTRNVVNSAKRGVKRKDSWPPAAYAQGPMMSSYGQSSYGAPPQPTYGQYSYIPGLSYIQLDERATAALQEIDQASADRIVALLREKIASGLIQNSSAYVMKAAGNAMRGNGDAGKRMRLERVVPELQEKLITAEDPQIKSELKEKQTEP